MIPASIVSTIYIICLAMSPTCTQNPFFSSTVVDSFTSVFSSVVIYLSFAATMALRLSAGQVIVNNPDWTEFVLTDIVLLPDTGLTNTRCGTSSVSQIICATDTLLSIYNVVSIYLVESRYIVSVLTSLDIVCDIFLRQQEVSRRIASIDRISLIP
jgi:hypothetical protein